MKYCKKCGVLYTTDVCPKCGVIEPKNPEQTENNASEHNIRLQWLALIIGVPTMIAVFYIIIKAIN